MLREIFSLDHLGSGRHRVGRHSRYGIHNGSSTRDYIHIHTHITDRYIPVIFRSFLTVPFCHRPDSPVAPLSRQSRIGPYRVLPQFMLSSAEDAYCGRRVSIL